MEVSLLLVKQIVELFLMIVLGYVLVKSRVLKEEEGQVISKIVLYGAAPCSIIKAFQIKATSSTISGLLLAMGAAVIVNLLFVVITKLFSKIFGFAPIEQASLIFPNSGNLIIPLVTTMLGGEYVLYASGYMVVQMFLIWSYGKNLVCNEPTINWKKILLSANMVAIYIGALLFILKISLPTIALETISTIGGMIGPLSMIVIGMGIANMDLSTIFTDKRVYLVSFFRLIVYPLIVILLFRIVPLASMHTEGIKIIMITLLAASAPVASTITQFAQLYNKHPGYASVINVMTVIFCIVTMPLMITVYQFIM